jgi:two-component system, NtrC family, response regulator
MWQLKIQPPSGESYFLKLEKEKIYGLGRAADADIQIQDTSLCALAGKLSFREESGTFWVEVPNSSPPLRLGDISVRSAEISPGITIRLGETRVWVQELNQDARVALPQPPKKGTTLWETKSQSGAQTLWLSKKASETELSVYLAGETGTGKDVLAKMIHYWSGRASGPFVPLHCGALALSLAESELFGHTKGSFTGAFKSRPGALLQAHNGTLFLDEVGDLPLEIQVKLLRFLEDGEIRPVGSDHHLHANVRIICATHKPLEALVKEGKFRQDLYYRLASVKVEIPTLRDRPKDIRLLADRFSKNLKKTLTEKAIFRLQNYSWPGNVRQLRHSIERAAGMAGVFQNTLDESCFDFLLHSGSLVESNSSLQSNLLSALNLREIEKVALLKALQLTHGNRAHAAQLLGVARSTLFEMLKRHKIQGPRQILQLAAG